MAQRLDPEPPIIFRLGDGSSGNISADGKITWDIKPMFAFDHGLSGVELLGKPIPPAPIPPDDPPGYTEVSNV
jgi:hypothetical protein